MIIKIYHKRSKVNKAGKAPLIFSINMGKQYWLPAYESIKIGAFKSQRVTAKEEFQSEINRSLRFRRGEIEKIIRFAEETGVSISQEYLTKEYKKRVGHAKTSSTYKESPKSLNGFWGYWVAFIKSGKNKYSEGYLRKFRQVRSHLESFNSNLDFENIDETFEDDYFYHFLIEKNKLSNNTVSKHLKCLRVVLQYAEKMGCKKVNAAFKNYKDLSVATKRMFLTWEEVEQIKEFEPLFDLDKQVKEIFMFSCYTGLRWQDINKLKPANFILRDENIYLDFHSLKSKKYISHILTKPAIQLAERYNFNLPKVSNQKCNEALKRIARGAGLKDRVEITKYYGSERSIEQVEKWKILSMHVGRHTFACEFLSRNKSHGLSALKALSDILGHSSTRTTEIYWDINSSEKDKMLIDSFG